jgi:hypothetical protein
VVDTGEGDEDSAPPKRQKGLVNSNGPRELNRSLRRGGSLLSHLAAISTFFRLEGLPPNQTPIGLGPSGGHPIKISISGAPLIGLGSLGGCPAYKLPTCRQGDPLWALNQ